MMVQARDKSLFSSFLPLCDSGLVDDSRVISFCSSLLVGVVLG